MAEKKTENRWRRAHALHLPTKNCMPANAETQHRVLQRLSVLACSTRGQWPSWSPPNPHQVSIKNRCPGGRSSHRDSAIRRKRCTGTIASDCRASTAIKISVKNYWTLSRILDFTLIRTDTTLDLSQKAEKVSVTRESITRESIGLQTLLQWGYWARTTEFFSKRRKNCSRWF